MTTNILKENSTNIRFHFTNSFKIFRTLTIVFSFITYIALSPIAFSQPKVLADSGDRSYLIASTTAPNTTQNNTTLLINEVSLKNTTKDWLTIKNPSSNNTSINLNGYYIKSDSVIKKFTTNTYLDPGDSITLFFKSPTEQDTEKIFYTKNSGLTGTTEQLILFSKEGKIIDALCWSNKNPTSSEQEDIENLYKNDSWVSKDFEQCVNSDQIKKNQNIIRINDTDTNSKSDWILEESRTRYEEETSNTKENQTSLFLSNGDTEQINYSSPTNGATRTASNKQANETEGKLTTSISSTKKDVKVKAKESSKSTSNKAKTVNNKITQKAKTTKPKSSSTTSKTKNAQVKTKTVKNGDLSTSIQVSEIYSNPDTKLKENEWIELYNNSDKDINLNNWQIDDEEGGSKPYSIKDKTIKAFSYLVLDKTETKLNLNNEKDTVRLLNFKKELIDQVEYIQSVKAKSYSRIIYTKDLDEAISEKISDITNNNSNGYKTENNTVIETQELHASQQLKLIDKRNSEDGVAKDNSTEFYWTTPTKGAPNPSYIITNGTINSTPLFDNTYSFEIKNKSRTTKILFSENVLSAQIAKLLLIPGTLIEVTLDKNKNQLITYKTYPIPSKDNKTNSDYIIPLILLATFFILYFLVKNRRSLYIFLRELKTKHNEKQQT